METGSSTSMCAGSRARTSRRPTRSASVFVQQARGFLELERDILDRVAVHVLACRDGSRRHRPTRGRDDGVG